MNYYSHHIGDFNNATRHLTRVERALYRDAIELYYDTESVLTLDFDKLCRRLLAHSDIEKEALSAVLAEFFIKGDGGYSHKRCDAEIAKYRANTSNKAKAGIASAAARQQKSTGVQQTFNEPITNNQEPLLKALVISDAKDLFLVEKHDCPHQEIIAIYHEVLPACPQVRDWTPARAQQLRARWNEDSKRQSLDWWRGLFAHIASCDFLVGKSGIKPFFATLSWITKAENFAKIREGNYDNRAAA